MPKTELVKLAVNTVPHNVKLGNAAVVAVSGQAVHALFHGLAAVRSWAGELAGPSCVLL